MTAWHCAMVSKISLRKESKYDPNDCVGLQMFDWLGGNDKGFISKEEVMNLSRDQMRALVLNFEGTDVSNTEEAEYGVIDVGDVR